jgi:hypothetical protein
MNFAFPAFLFALSAVSIPIFIHLFNLRRYKKIYFSNVKFLRAINEETQKRAKLKHLLILASRISAIIFLVLAFSQPVIPSAKSTVKLGDNVVSIFIDNSFSMETVNKNGSLLDEAKKRAKEIVNAFAVSDKFHLFTNDFEGKHQRLLSKEEMLNSIDEIKISTASKMLSNICSRSFDLLAKSNTVKKKLFVLSDFQQSVTDVSKIKNDTSIAVTLIPLLSQSNNNIYIDSCWFATPVRQAGANEKLMVKIINASDKEVENSSIKLFINGVQKTPASFSIAAQSDKTIELSFAIKDAGNYNCLIQLEDFPVTFDDKYYFSFSVAPYIPVLCVEGADVTADSKYNPVKSLFSDSVFKLTVQSEGKIDFSSFTANKLIVANQLEKISSGLNQQFEKFVHNGGSLLLIPSANLNSESYGTLCSTLNLPKYETLDTANTKVDKINFEHAVYRGVFEKKSTTIDLPVVLQQYRFSKNINTTEDYLMRTQNNNSFAASYKYKNGTVYLLSAPLADNYSNFARHALFVPTFYKIAFNSLSESKLYNTISVDDNIVLSNLNVTGDRVFHLSGNNNFDVIPEHKNFENNTTIYFRNQITNSGNYSLNFNDSLIAPVSFNYSNKESSLAVLSFENIVSGITESGMANFSVIKTGEKSVVDTIKEFSQGTKLWKHCIILALLFLAVEIALIRLLK